MQYTNNNNFKRVCHVVLFIFYVQILQPAAFGYTRQLVVNSSSDSLSNQSWSLLNWLIPAAQAADDPLLASTPDADITDPFIIEKAAELGNDPEQIFAFVRDEIGFESYVGSLRGARGTLWSKAGNALDQASLLIALLRVSGVPAQYAQGTLPDDLAKELILSMFPEPLRILGFLPDNAELFDPLNDPQLLEEVRDHYWVEYSKGDTFETIDTTFKNSLIGQSHTSPQHSFNEVPDALRHKIRLRLKAEFGSSFPGLPADIRISLDETFDTVELIGKSLSLGHSVNTDTSTGLLFADITHTYSPYLIVDDNSLQVSDNPVIRGVDYQEFLSNFPLASKFLTGVFLVFDVIQPGGEIKTFERTLVDRIGFAVRQNGGTTDLNIASDKPPIINNFDIFTVLVQSGFLNESAAELNTDQLNASVTTISQEIESITNLSAPSEKPAQDEQLKVLNIIRNSLVSLNRHQAATYVYSSDFISKQIANLTLVRAYIDSPKIIITSKSLAVENNELLFRSSIDLRKEDIRVIPHPGQSTDVLFAFNLYRGIVDNAIEQAVISPKSINDSGLTIQPRLNTSQILEHAVQQFSDFAIISKENVTELEVLDISSEAKARIQKTVSQNKIVIMPSRSVDLNGNSTIAWYEINRQTGETIGVTEDGLHQGLFERSLIQLHKFVLFADITDLALFAFVEYQVFIATNASLVAALAATGVLVREAVAITQVALEKSGGVSPEVTDSIDNAVENFDNILDIISTFLFPSTISIENIAGFPDSPKGIVDKIAKATPRALANYFGLVDPPIFPFLVKDPETLLDTELTENMPVRIVSDNIFTVPFLGMQLPFAFRARIHNFSQIQESFSLNFPNIPPEFEVKLSVSTITIPSGQTGEVGISIHPVGQIPPSGDSISLDLTVTNTETAFFAQASKQFVIPELPGIVLSTDNNFVSTSPGMTIPSTLNVLSVGNVPIDNLSLNIQTPQGLLVSDLNSITSINVGESLSQSISLTPAADIPLNTQLTATITATFGVLPDGTPQTASIQINVTVVAEEALTTTETANYADEIGRPQLSNTINSIARTITNLSQEPENEALQSRMQANLNSLIEQFNGAALTPFIPDLEAIRTAIVDGTDIPAALADLSNLMTGLGQVLQTDTNALPFDLTLGPNNIAALPATPSRFNLILRNNSSQTSTYDLALSALPASVSGGLNVNSITLAPGQSTLDDDAPAAFVTLMQSAQQLLAFDFSVNASLQGGNGLARTAHGAFTTREEILKVLDVRTDPGFTDPGGQVNIAARLLNSANQARDVSASYRVIAPDGATIFNSAPALVQLTTLDSLQTVDLGELDTTGFAIGSHQIQVSILDAEGNPVPEATGQSDLLIGSPVNAFLTVDPQTLPPGDNIVTTQLHLENLLAPIMQTFSLIGQANTIATKSMAIHGEIAYACGAEDIAVVDVADPENPQALRTFADDLLTGATITNCITSDNQLLVLWQLNTSRPPMHLLIFNLDDPRQPQLVSNTEYTRRFVQKPFIQGNTLFVSTAGIGLTGTRPINTFGNLLAFDISDPSSPVLTTSLYTNSADGDLFYKGGGMALGNDYILQPSTSCQTHGLNCAGRLLTIDSSDPANMSVLGSLRVGGSSFLTDIAAQGNLAVLASTNGGIPSPVDFGNPDKTTGNLVITTLDISDPLLPKIFKTITTDITMAGLSSSVVPLGNSLFAVGFNRDTNGPVIIIVDANDPENPVITNFPVLNFVAGMVSDGDFLYAASNGVKVFDLGNAFGTQISAQLRIPNNSALAGTQNLSLRGGIILNPSSVSFLPQGRFAENSVDDDLFSQWWTGSNDVVNRGGSPFYEIIFPESVTVNELNIFGNRTYSGSFTVEAGIFQLFDDQDNEIFNSGEAVLTVTEGFFKDVFVDVPSVSGVKRARFSFTQDSGRWAGFSEFQVIGRLDDLSDHPFANAFEPPPAEIITGDEFTTVTWDFSFPGSHPTKIVSWQSILNGLQPGEAREVILGGTVDFTTPAGDRGQFDLAPLFVSSEQILSLFPASQPVQAGDPVSYILSLKNPSGEPITYNLSVQGIPLIWINLPTFVTVPANASVDQLFTLQTDDHASPGDNGFVITASTDSGILGLINGSAIVSAIDNGLGEDIESLSIGVLTTLSPLNVTIGQGTSATVAVRITNTGNASETFNLSANLPGGVVPQFTQTSIEVPPGLDNFREVALILTAQSGATTGSQSYTVTTRSSTKDNVAQTANGSLLVSPQGVGLTINPQSGTPGQVFEVSVTNTGSTEDTFDLATAGPLGSFAALEFKAVTLAAGASKTVSLTLEAIDFVLPGSLELAVVASSRNNSAVSSHVSTQINIAELKGVEARFQPQAINLLNPGAQQFLLLIDNIGNQEDGYSATITQTSGPVVASLRGLDGLPTQQVPVFRLPGLSSGAIVLNAVLDNFGEGQVTVVISSSSDTAIKTSTTAFIRSDRIIVNQAPIADAGADQNVKAGDLVILDGSHSFDPENDAITFNWQFDSDSLAKPTASQLSNSDLIGRYNPKLVFTPDVNGLYRFELRVDDGLLTSLPSKITIAANNDNVPPNAVAGEDQYIHLGDTVVLNGGLSDDPDTGPASLSYNWTLTGLLPVDSNLTDNNIINATNVEAAMTPDGIGNYEIHLNISDGQDSDGDNLIVHVLDSNRNLPPVTRAGNDKTVALGEEVTFDGSDSHDQDGPDALTVNWYLIHTPENSNLSSEDIIDRNTFIPRISPDVTGQYIFRLETSDGLDKSADNVLLTVVEPLVFQELTGQLDVIRNNQRSSLNRRTRQITSIADITLINRAPVPITGPLEVVIIPSALGVSMPEADRINQEGNFVFDLSDQLSEQTLAPNESVTFRMRLIYSSRLRVSYEVLVFGKMP